MKKRMLATLLALCLVLSLGAAAFAADGEEAKAAFDPVTLADNDMLKIVLIDAYNGEDQHTDAYFTMEIENKTDIGLDISLDTFAINDMMWDPLWQEDSPFSQSGDAIFVPAGETVTATAKWQSIDMERLGINYAERAEGTITTQWDYAEYSQQIMATTDYDTDNAIEEMRAAAEERIPISFEFPAARTGFAASEDVVYLTDFERVVIVDDGSVTAAVCDYYVNIWPTLVVSVENHTDDILTCDWTPMNVDGYEVDSVGSFGFVGNTVLPGKTLIAELSISGTTIGEIVYNDTYTEVISDTTEEVEFDSADNITLPLSITKEDGSIYLQASVELDVSDCDDVSSGIHGTAEYVTGQAMMEGLDQQEVEAYIDTSSGSFIGYAAWMPPPDNTAAVTALGDNGEFVIGLSYIEQYQGIVIYFENNSDETVELNAKDTRINGSSFPSDLGYFADSKEIPSGHSVNYCIIDYEAEFASSSFEAEIDFEVLGEDQSVLTSSTVSASFSETGEATIN